ncbi:MAG: protease HtpX [Candidatus Melainabacteria bacterium]|nr:MAG: protease HtpX [Candidatus Melainabacteria bacterium]
MNFLKTILLLGILSGFMIAIGNYFGGQQGMIIALIFALITNVVSFWFSAPLALKMSGAQPVERSQAPELYAIVETLAQRANLPVPTIHIIPSQAANAFATGRDPKHSAIAVTEGIMRILDRDELISVLAHELGHVRNRDILITTIAAVMAGAIIALAQFAQQQALYGSRDGQANRNPIAFFLLILLAPIAASLVQLAVSRTREFEADATGARMCKEPLELASALEKVDQASKVVPFTEANPALSSLYIMKPDPGNWCANLFSTHPSTAERIARLEKMAQSQLS